MVQTILELGFNWVGCSIDKAVYNKQEVPILLLVKYNQAMRVRSGNFIIKKEQLQKLISRAFAERMLVSYVYLKAAVFPNFF